MTQKEKDKELKALRKKLAAIELKADKSEELEEKLGNQLSDAEDETYSLRNEAENLAFDIDDLDQEVVEDDEEDLVERGEIPSPEQAKLMKNQKHSYGVTFVRSEEKKGQKVLHSDRRFSSRKEAEQHGKRFAKKHNHEEFSVCIVQKKANAWVNWKTGKTNPAL
jgi:hypothetical protein